MEMGGFRDMGGFQGDVCLLAMTALWVRIQTSLKKTKWATEAKDTVQPAKKYTKNQFFSAPEVQYAICNLESFLLIIFIYLFRFYLAVQRGLAVGPDKVGTVELTWDFTDPHVAPFSYAPCKTSDDKKVHRFSVALIICEV